MKLKALLIKSNQYYTMYVDNTYEALKEVLDFDSCWNTPTIRVRNQTFIAICSDTGKITRERVSALSYQNIVNPTDELREPFLVGNILIVRYNGIDDFESLTSRDIELLESRIIPTQPLSWKQFYKNVLIID